MSNVYHGCEGARDVAALRRSVAVKGNQMCAGVQRVTKGQVIAQGRCAVPCSI